MPRRTVETVHSAGGVIARGTAEDLEVALIATHTLTRWALPKGIVEAGETPETTAAREVQEETGLTGLLLDHLDQVEYWYVPRADTKRHKFVDFYLFRWVSGEPHPQTSEVDDVRWFPITEALHLASYKSERAVLIKAQELWPLFEPPADCPSCPTSPAASE